MIFNWLQGFIDLFFLIKSKPKSIFNSNTIGYTQYLCFSGCYVGRLIAFFRMTQIAVLLHWCWLQIIQKTCIWFGICMASFAEYQ